MVHTLRATLADNSIISEEHWSLLADFENGFNTGDRGKMLEEVKAQYPQLYPGLSPAMVSTPSSTLGFQATQ